MTIKNYLDYIIFVDVSLNGWEGQNLLRRGYDIIEGFMNMLNFEQEGGKWVLECNGFEAKKVIKKLETMKKKFDLQYSISIL